jgi:hypothetical protein
MVSMDYNGNIMISPDIMVFQNGDIMEISWRYHGDIMVSMDWLKNCWNFCFLETCWILPLEGQVTSPEVSCKLSQSWNWSKETFQKETSRETSGISRETHRENFL